MKIEARGKYPGVKVHLDEEETQMFLKLAGSQATYISGPVAKFSIKLAGKINTLTSEHPNLVEERTQEEVLAALLRDQAKIQEQLAAIAAKHDWKKV